MKQSLKKLSEEVESLMRSLQPSASEPALQFIESQRRICWHGGAVKLPVKQYQLLAAVWFGKEHTADVPTIERAVWFPTVERTKLPVRPVKKGTFFMLIHRTRDKMSETGFPYELTEDEWNVNQQVLGYKLVPLAR